MNRKGFTLIELLAVIVILGLVLVITIPLISDSFRKSKLKSEEVFVKRISTVIDEYEKLNSDTLMFTSSRTAIKHNSGLDFVDTEVIVGMTNITMEDIINSGLLKPSDYVNAGNKNTSCDKDALIVIYKDSDGVYCHSFRAEDLGCVSSEYGGDIINTCVWEWK